MLNQKVGSVHERPEERMSETGTILVTGGAGFIGTQLVEQLVSAGHQVRVLDKPGVDVTHLPIQQIEVAHVDICDADGVMEAAEGCTVVLHLAANPNLWDPNPSSFEQVNHQGTRHVLAAAHRHGARKTVFVSTESILAPPGLKGVITEQTVTTLKDMIGPYCRSKWLAERAAFEAAESGQPVIVVRPSVPVGAGDRSMVPLSRMMCDYINGRIKGYMAGELNLIDVRDVAAGIWAAAQRGNPGQPYLLVNENWTVQELLTFLASLIHCKPPKWRVPYRVAWAYAHIEELVIRLRRKGLPMATVTGVRLTQRRFHFDGRQSAEQLQLAPMRSCRTSIVDAVKWYHQRELIKLEHPIGEAGEVVLPPS